MGDTEYDKVKIMASIFVFLYPLLFGIYFMAAICYIPQKTKEGIKNMRIQNMRLVRTSDLMLRLCFGKISGLEVQSKYSEHGIVTLLVWELLIPHLNCSVYIIPNILIR